MDRWTSFHIATRAAVAISLCLCVCFTSSVEANGDTQATSNCLTRKTLEMSLSCVNYTYKPEEYDEYKIKLEEEMADNSVLQQAWRKSKVGEDAEQKVSFLRDEEYRAVKLLSNHTYKHTYKEYTRQLINHGSVTAPNFKYKGLHYFLSSAFKKLSVEWGSRRRVVHVGVHAGEAGNVDCLVNTTTKFAGFALAYTDLHRAERAARNEGTVFSMLTSKNVDISGITKNRDAEMILISPCDNFNIITTLRRRGDRHDVIHDVVKMVTTHKESSAIRMTSSVRAVLAIALFYALAYIV